MNKRYLVCANGTWTEIKAGSVGQAVQMYGNSLLDSEEYVPDSATVYEISDKNDTFYGKWIKNEKAIRAKKESDTEL